MMRKLALDYMQELCHTICKYYMPLIDLYFLHAKPKKFLQNFYRIYSFSFAHFNFFSGNVFDVFRLQLSSLIFHSYYTLCYAHSVISKGYIRLLLHHSVNIGKVLKSVNLTKIWISESISVTPVFPCS